MPPQKKNGKILFIFGIQIYNLYKSDTHTHQQQEEEQN
jgi:hypothetical protein